MYRDERRSGIINSRGATLIKFLHGYLYIRIRIQSDNLHIRIIHLILYRHRKQIQKREILRLKRFDDRCPLSNECEKETMFDKFINYYLFFYLLENFKIRKMERNFRPKSKINEISRRVKVSKARFFFLFQILKRHRINFPNSTNSSFLPLFPQFKIERRSTIRATSCSS